MMDVSTIARLAAILEARGTITVGRYYPTTKSSRYSYLLRVTIGMDDNLAFLQRIQAEFGGSLRVDDKSRIDYLTVTSRKAARMLATVYPYLTSKREKVQVATEFQRVMSGIDPRANYMDKPAYFRAVYTYFHGGSRPSITVKEGAKCG